MKQARMAVPETVGNLRNKFRCMGRGKEANANW